MRSCLAARARRRESGRVRATGSARTGSPSRSDSSADVVVSDAVATRAAGLESVQLAPSEPEVSFRACDCLLRERCCRQRFVEVASQVRVAGCALSLRYLRDDVVAAARVDDQRALGAAEEPLGCLATPIAGEDVRDVMVAVLVACDEGP